ncbi:nuclear pore glycoprotein P62, putative [Schistosoma mansoni]|uniref:Nuclear pore glycoprotein P62, putative n=1 Tax=Schistosoma mansoni TaxID=6183 RepID=G4LWN8_SCHMA|nr:nuclear pore glycoprotein P62, putative [Schistosoma mansoni]|eukprot:XP_018645678.1 nuclear pore glycoprotein P62, putative [Schistosoma mansoni]
MPDGLGSSSGLKLSNMSGFSFGKPATTSAFAFGSSPFGTSAGTKPTFGVSTSTTSLFSPAVASSSNTAVCSSSLLQNSPSLSLTSTSGFGTVATTSNAFGLSSFASLAKPSTTVSTFGTSSITGLGTNSNLTPTSQSALNQPSVNPLPSLLKPATTTSNVGSSFTFGLTTAISTQSTVTPPISFGTLSSTTVSTGAPTASIVNVHASQPAIPSSIGFGVSSASLSSSAITSTAATIAMTSYNFGNPSLSTLAKSAAASGFGTSSLGIATRTLGETATTAAAITTSLCATIATTTTSIPSATTTSSVSVTSSQTLTYNQLEELVNKWTLELEEQERYFFDEADRINQWDQTLICNAENITAMYKKVEMCQCEQSRLEQELDFIEGQQRELESLLEPLERAVNELPPGQLHSDYEREAIFQLATNVDLELGQLLTDLREIADQTNTTTMNVTTGFNSSDNSTTTTNATKENTMINGNNKLTSSNNGDIMNQITRILNCHMHSLNWIHHNTQEIMDRLKVLNGVS